ncbi:peptide chain release factor N(5)-glutamine methyltransferase [Arthrobacter sp. 35W]|uniref:peptide chain release factor N(5)-glutamine methyltransferase n=1 Tax=Arthrobacter sp. 35W TaxID=1132441 RepID=UPI000428AFFB|nr:peptide chain release factor N(5)-glutamine methyltransferase [Arthrobacter sp. 35W]
MAESSPRPLEAALSAAAAVLAEAGVPSPRVDAELLAAHLLGVGRGELRAMAMGSSLEPAGFDALIGRRAGREPLQHITGTAYFRHLELAVGPGVFVPRPETESVVQLGLDWLSTHRGADSAHDGGAAPVVVDLGTGSGAIAGSVAHEVPGASVHAVELSPEAHVWAARNLAGSGVELVLGDMRTAFPELDGTVDLVISNPPYIPAEAIPRDPEVARFDPHMALYGGGADGMETPRAAEATAARLLKAGGFFVMEHAEVQAEQMAAMLRGTGHWSEVSSHRDLTGRDRATSALRTGPATNAAMSAGTSAVTNTLDAAPNERMVP